MQIPITVESIGSDTFRAQGVPPLAVMAEGRTSDEAVAKLSEKIRADIADGIELVKVEPREGQNPWVAMAGSLKDNPLLDEWRAAIEEYRRQCDQAAGIEYDDGSS